MRFAPPGALPGMSRDHLTAVREAFAGMSAGRLPPQLLFSDRDFTEADYEMLLALDEGVENRRGAHVLPRACLVYEAECITDTGARVLFRSVRIPCYAMGMYTLACILSTMQISIS